MKSFEALLGSSAAAHGHLCPGQVVGVRMAMLGCRLIGLDEPASHNQIKKGDPWQGFCEGNRAGVRCCRS